MPQTVHIHNLSKKASCRLFWVKSKKGLTFTKSSHPSHWPQKSCLLGTSTEPFHYWLLTTHFPRSHQNFFCLACEEQGPSVQHCGFTRLRKKDRTNWEKGEQSTSGPPPFPSYPYAAWATSEKSQRCSSTSMIVIGMVNASYSIELLWRYCWEGVDTVNTIKCWP